MTDYSIMTEQLKALAETDAHYVPLFSNAAAILWEALPDINWAGFYLVRGEQLVLGPFQGKVACVHIRRGAGVCGTAWERDETQLVPDVHAFPGHIACDGASNSEIVVPIHRDGEVCGVLDIDSPSFGRFSEADREGLEEFVRTLERAVIFSEEEV
ncbi:MAG: GAF domain-containing protein [Lachnospiraceae bacterium]|nr:GAF domain-containing protein [Lachnospiraceae bacterium]